MSLLQAILMGVVQGLTEFLPVSSSGHLALFKNIFHVNTDTGLLFDILLHVGTLMAVVAVYFKDIAKLIAEGIGILADLFRNAGIFFRNLSSGKKKEYVRVIHNGYRKFVLLVIVSTIPTGIVGILMRDVIEVAEGALLIPGICLILTGGILFIADTLKGGTKTIREATLGNAAAVGLCQGISTLPGISRSGTTITACLLCGFDRRLAVKYSFIMSIPAVLGAAVLEVKDIGKLSVPPAQIVYYIAGMIAAGLVGYVCIKTMLVVVRNRKFKYFSAYCLVVGVIALVGYFVQ